MLSIDSSLNNEIGCKTEEAKLVYMLNSLGLLEFSLEGLMLKLELPILWPPDAKNWLTGKDPDAGKVWGQEEKGTTEDEMVGWHHRFNGHESEWTLGVGDGQGGLACCNSWGFKESDTTEWLNWTEHEYTGETQGNYSVTQRSKTVETLTLNTIIAVAA